MEWVAGFSLLTVAYTSSSLLLSFGGVFQLKKKFKQDENYYYIHELLELKPWEANKKLVKSSILLLILSLFFGFFCGIHSLFLAKS